MKIDIHAHLMPERWESLKEKYGYGGFITLDHHRPGFARMLRDDGVFFREVEQNCWDSEYVLRDMDAHNTDVMVLSTIPVLFSYWAQPEHTLDWSRFLNNHLAEVVAKHPTRFIALGTLPMNHIEFAIEEMKRCVNELGMPGVQIGSNINGMNLDNKGLFPLYQAAQDIGCSLFVHPWEMAGADRMKPYFQEWLVGMPAETTLAMTSMIFGGVFDTFPDLRVLFSHAGGAFPFTIGRISHGWHARQDLCNVNSIRDPREYIGKFWVDGITHDANAFAFLLKTMGSDKICYGTDYPFPLGDLEHGKFIETMEAISDSIRADVLWNNAFTFLNRSPQSYLR